MTPQCTGLTERSFWPGLCRAESGGICLADPYDVFPPAHTLAPFFEPSCVAVVGASRERNKIGSEILHNLVATGFTGAVVPVHPTAATIRA